MFRLAFLSIVCWCLNLAICITCAKFI
jgi:hypothetical protein